MAGVSLTLTPLMLEATAQTSVSFLVPADSPAAQHASRVSPSGWARVEVVLSEPGSAHALAAVKDWLGPQAVRERVYDLHDPGDEPLFVHQWSLENTGQSGGIPDADIDASLAWGVSNGAGVLVAVVDSGVDGTHPDLVGRTVAGWDTIDWDADPSPVGPGFNEAHGTMVAGIIVAGDNGVGIAGVAPEAKVLNMRACSGGTCMSLDIADAIYLAVDAGAQIINLSFGTQASSDLPVEAAIDYARSHDVLVVAAAGNGGDDGVGDDIDSLPGGQKMIPAGLPDTNILSVSASDRKDRKPVFANYGQSVDVFAPGVDILTTGAAGLPAYVEVSGTSFSAPIVSGIAALLLASEPVIGHQELKARVEVFTDKPALLSGYAANGRVNAGSTLTTRFTDTHGSIFVNAIDWLALQRITTGCNPPYNYKYCPGQNVTRGEMAVFFARAFHLPSTSTDYFNDDDGLFYEAAANKMAQAGVTVGCAPNKYCGERDISREEMAAMLARVLGLAPASKDHFVDDANSIFEGAINKIAAVGVTQGCNPPTNNKYCPLDKVTRGEMSAFIKRAVSLAS
jgi:hypothetical protein